METITVTYSFTFSQGSQQIYKLIIDKEKIELINDNHMELPSWVNLDFHQCPNCPLTPKTHPHCPLAINLVDIVEIFDGLVSYEEIHVEVVTEERRISQKTSLQRGVSSLMGLVIATSSCPHTDFFKPMAYHHLPLATREETFYRATSSYLLAQYFMKNDGIGANLELEGLIKIYENIQIINTAVANRLRAVTETDSSINAIILLDAYAKAIPFFIEKYLDELRCQFNPFINSRLKD